MNVNPVGWASRTLAPLLRIIRTSPNATVPVIAVSEPVASETSAIINSDIALVAKGTGATLAQVPDGTSRGGDKRGAYATDFQKVRNSATMAATGSESVIAGGRNNTASGATSCIGGGEDNVASSTNSTVAGGSTNTCSGFRAVIGGGSINVCSATLAVVCGGDSNSNSGEYASIVGGQNHQANSTHSFISGGARGTTRGIIGYHVFPASNVPITNTAGVTQSALLILGRQTTTATPAVLASNSSAATTNNQVILPNNSAYSFSGEVIAGVTSAGNTARWTIEGAIKRGANAASTAMVGTPTVTMTHNDAGASAWTVAVTADTTNGGIKVEVTGAASTTIRWVCKINTTEMTF